MVSFLNILRLTLLAVASTAVYAQDCADVHLVYARGTFQAAGLAKEGQALLAGLKTDLPGKTVTAYAVNYKADALQTSAGAGATDMTKHIVSYAASCPNAVFVIGGFSQGATVTDIAIGIDTILGKGQVIPETLAPRIKAVVTFGNPLKLLGHTIAQKSPLYAAKAIEYCNKGDPICGAGVNAGAHLDYDKTSASEAAQRAAKLVLGVSRHLRTEN